MRHLREAVHRHRRMALLFGLMVLLPVTVFGLLVVRAMRGERIRAEYESTARQRAVVTELNDDLTGWLFAAGPGSARATALLHFHADAGRLVFPAFQLALDADDSPEQRPFDSGPPPLPLTREAVVEQYFPRVQAFRRDAAAGRNAGAQYFPRLAALVVQPPSAPDGYVVDVERVLEHANARLAAITAAEPFTATAWIAAQRPSSRPTDSVGLAGFPFFEVVFEDRPAPAAGLRGQLFPYSMGLLIVVTVLGSAFMYRAVSHESRLARLRSDFVAAVSHEFRSPLASILALTERLDRVDDPERRREYHAIIGRDARRLSTLVTRLLDFALIEEGQKIYALERIDLADTARDAVATSRAAGRPDRIQLAEDRPPRPLWVRADRTALAHAIQNLVDNAAKYSPPDAPIRVACGSADGQHFVNVEDTGIGILPSEQTKIFEKFYRGRQAAPLNAEGVGIGLSLVRHVMDRHGGSVTVESEPGRGSRFSLRLPAAGG